MDTLWAFGDSFTESYVAQKDAPKHWRTNYIDWKGYETKVYARRNNEYYTRELG